MKHVGVLTDGRGAGDPAPHRRRWRLRVVRGSLDALKARVLKRRARRMAAHIDKSIKQIRGSHEWARRHARMLRALGVWQ